MSEVQLNLARKWRSKQFEQIVGQDLSIRILKNSLFLGKYFPVYLFAGQHGCGKTTTARVFAAAVNCERLPDFMQSPKKFIVPCLECDSCKAMMEGRHPDFVEIDAASHTGVDNVRQIIEASTLLPLLGRKKIYLIDEAHMLSKAAFNAFLKILEEPPDSVFFILATTDDHKIIDTVRSRCFQLFFNAVDQKVLLDYLTHICETEEVAFDREGLNIIIKETGGSVRDALNLLEQVRFGANKVGEDEVLAVLGHLPDGLFLQLFRTMLTAASPEELISYIEEIKLSDYNVDYVWRRLLYLLRVMVWIKGGIKPQDFLGEQDMLRAIGKLASFVTLIDLFDFFCTQEQVFLKTLHKTTFLELFLVRAWHMMQQKNKKVTTKIQEESSFLMDYEKVLDQPIEIGSQDKKESVVLPLKTHKPVTDDLWVLFLSEIEQLDEPLLVSVFKQAQFEKFEDSQVFIHFTSRLQLFEDTFEQLQGVWMPKLGLIFGSGVRLRRFFDLSEQACEVKKKIQGTGDSLIKNFSINEKSNKELIGGSVDVTDKNRWPLTHQLLQSFPGKVVEVPVFKQEQGNE